MSESVIAFSTKADMDVDLSPADGVIALVTNDAISSNNQAYRKSGASGSGTWDRTPDRFVSVLGNAEGFQNVGAGAVVRTFLAKLLNRPKDVQDYYLPEDGDDYGPAFARAIQVTKRVNFPEGQYTIANPVNYVQGLEITGAAACQPDSDGATRIHAPNGFIKNPGTTRMRITVRNVHIVGDGSSIGINGPFGGLIEDCRIEGYVSCIANASAYLSRYVRCSFVSAQFGLNLADTNGTLVHACYFDASVKTGVSNCDITPLSGTNSGAPLTIENNNYNVSGTFFTGQSVNRLRGLIDFNNNYMEDFAGPAPSASTFVEVVVNRFDNFGFTCYNNLMNGQGRAAIAFSINGSSTSTNPVYGSITANHASGFTAADIKYGTFNNITGLRIYDNSWTNGAIPSLVGGPLVAYRPLVNISMNGAVSIAGDDYVTLPFRVVDIDNTGGADTANSRYSVKKAGYYRVTVAVDIATKMNHYPDVELVLYNNGVIVATANTSLNFVADTTADSPSDPADDTPCYGQIRIERILSLAAANILLVKARQGDTAERGTITFEYLGDGNS